MNEAKNPNPLFMPRTYLTTESNKTGSWRFLRPRYDEKTSPCSATCPAGEDIARIEMLATQGLFKEAWETILRENPFPSVCGRVCFHPCEGQCNRREFDTAVAIHSLERFLADTAIRYGIKPDLEKRSSQKQKIAVIGAGPAGLSAAWFLSMLGYACHVFEASAEAGGVLRWGVSAIIGGGNTAIDVARSVVRLGGKALLLYRRRRQDMPALELEVEMALEEGVELQELVAPAAVAREGDQVVLTLQEMKIAGEEGGRGRVIPDEGKTRKVRIDRIFKAIGAQADEPRYQPPAGASGLLRLSHTVLVRGDQGAVMVFGGDLTNETKSVVHAVASGKQVAMALDTLFQEGIEAMVPKLEACRVGEGPSLSMEIYMGGERRLRNPHVVRYEEINTDYFRFIPRVTQPRLLKEERVQSFEEIDLKISAQLAMKESERCFNCGLCNQCDNCFIFCPDTSVIRDKDHQERHINYDYCKGCGLCVVECPRNAMSLGEEKS
ncbi:MAG: NAD(P)-binding protein [Deltaproteobacteria bacterium]|nr:NAD(P)-binding protein [Deltaproteobacteria bacterium]